MAVEQAFQRLLEKSEKSHLSRRSTPMNADKPIPFNPRLSVFIGGQPCFGFFRQALSSL